MNTTVEIEEYLQGLSCKFRIFLITSLCFSDIGLCDWSVSSKGKFINLKTHQFENYEKRYLGNSYVYVVDVALCLTCQWIAGTD